MSRLRSLAALISRTPLHPQWLLGSKRPPEALSSIRGNVLDIGSANGWLQLHIPADCFYVAFDYPITATHMYGTRPHVFGDAGKLPFAEGSFDHVACLEVLEHVRDPEAVLREVARVLRFEGRAHFTMPFLYPVHDAPHDYQRWTEFGWRRSAEAAGFEVRKISPAHHPVISAAVLGCLALAAPLQSARLLRLVLLLLPTVLLVCVVNISACLLARLWPTWRGMTLGYQIELSRK